MDPKPCTCASTLRAWRHSSRNLEIRKPSPDASLINTENGEIFRFYFANVRLVGNSKTTALQIAESSRMILRWWRAGANVITASDITSLGRCEERSRALVTANLKGRCFASRQLEPVLGMGRIIEVTMEPPLIESIICKRCNRSIVVRECLLCDIKSPHARMPDRYNHCQEMWSCN